MNQSGFTKLYWGFLFILIDFRISGFDVLPNFIGYILFAVGFSILAQNSIYFVKARNFNIPMIILSLFSFYQEPAHESGINFGRLGFLSIPVSLAAIALSILTIYNLFMGIKDMAVIRSQMDLYTEADTRWKQFLFLQLAFILVFVFILIPGLALVYIILMYIISIAITVLIMKFMKYCGERLN
jgi:hypothetical protein